jgi:ferric-dicitrate binding protein FerR (iron transport regulator)
VTANKQGLLHFENTALADVILRFGEVYNKKIVLLDSAIARERFTAQLDDQPFEGAMEILSQSLNIKYYSENGVYYLKKE